MIQLLVHPFFPLPNVFSDNSYDSIEIIQSIHNCNAFDNVNYAPLLKEMLAHGNQPLSDQSIIDVLTQSKINQKLDFLLIQGCSNFLLVYLLHLFQRFTIKYLKIVSFTMTQVVKKLIESMIVDQIDIEDFVIESDVNPDLNHIGHITLSLYRGSLIDDLVHVLDGLNDEVESLIEINLGVGLKSIHPLIESNLNDASLIKLGNRLIRLKKQIKVLSIDYPIINDTFTQQLIQFVNNNQKLTTLDVPLISCDESIILRFFESIGTAKNIRIFLSNLDVFNPNVIQSIHQLIQRHDKMWYFVHESLFYINESQRTNNQMLNEIGSKLEFNYQ